MVADPPIVRAFSSREDALEFGALLGEDTARRVGEVDDRGQLTSDGKVRVQRAIAYAAWEWDGGRLAAAGDARTEGQVSSAASPGEGVGADDQPPRSALPAAASPS